ncbi:MAG: nitroreductase family protein [Chloroflexi bacterium]|nr:nitroreductase family protein [Chloroflexota bacterium]
MNQVSAEAELFLDIVRRRRNIRRFKPDPVPDEYITMIVEAARLAPSGANSQPWEFIVVKDAERKRQIADAFIEAARKGREFDPKFPAAAEGTLLKKVAEAPVLIAVCCDPRFKEAYPSYANRDGTFFVSLGNAMENMHLMATALGLAMAWGTTNRFSDGPISGLLGVRPPLYVKEVFSFGFPVATPPAKYRRSLSEVIHFEQMDSSKVRTDEHVRDMIENRRVSDVYAASESAGAE